MMQIVQEVTIESTGGNHSTLFESLESLLMAVFFADFFDVIAVFFADFFGSKSLSESSSST